MVMNAFQTDQGLAHQQFSRRRFLLGSVLLSVLYSRLIHPNHTNAQEGEIHPLMISEMRKQSYPGSDLMIEQTLPTAGGYDR